MTSKKTTAKPKTAEAAPKQAQVQAPATANPPSGKKGKKGKAAPSPAPDAPPGPTAPNQVLTKILELAPRQAEIANEIRAQQGLDPAEFELQVWWIDEITPTQPDRPEDDSAVANLASLIEEFGASGRQADYAPIAVDEGGKVTDGHFRLRAYRAAGFSHVPVLAPRPQKRADEAELAAASEMVPPAEVPAESAAEATEPAVADTDPVPELVPGVPPTPSRVSIPEPAPTEAPKVKRVRAPKAEVPGAAKKMSALNAAARVLQETGQALTCQELIDKMATAGYWSSPGGKTPAATLYSAIIREMQTKGADSRFKKAGPGKFTRNE